MERIETVRSAEGYQQFARIGEILQRAREFLSQFNWYVKFVNFYSFRLNIFI